jgi:hypothetical protein
MRRKFRFKKESDDSVSFNEFMEKQGLYAEVKARALKGHLIYLFEKAMKEKNLTKSDMARKAFTCRTCIDNILDPAHNSTFKSLIEFASLLDKEITISLRDRL